MGTKIPKGDKRGQVVDNLPPVLDMTQAAKYLSIPKPTLYTYAPAGLVPATKIGGRWRFHKPTLDEWLATETKKNLKKVEMRMARNGR